MPSSSGERKLKAAAIKISERSDQQDRNRCSAASIRSADPEVWQAIKAENKRQHEHIELIASENYASPAVMEAQGSA
jgi:hypothetical protein